MLLTQVDVRRRSRSLPDKRTRATVQHRQHGQGLDVTDVMTVPSFHLRLVVAAFCGMTLSMAGCALGISSGIRLIDAAQAQSTEQPLKDVKRAVESLINRMRGRDMPEGIVKSNGRLEATQVDVSAKYPGRLATLTVNV